MPIIKRRCIGWIRIFAMFADGFMTLRSATKKAGLRRAFAFEDLPDDWVCPLCGVGKDQFSKQ